MSSNSVLQNYRDELATALQWKAEGQTSVDSVVAGPALAKGRARTPIDEYIAHWQVGITAMEAGWPQELFNY